jgi:hypothetical protein
VELLEATLQSVCRQTDDDYRVVVVHNESPPITPMDSRISLVSVDFPAPSEQRTAEIDFDKFKRDKGTKCIVGVVAARDLGANHVMFIDADDLMHRGLAEFANADTTHPGWYSPMGLIHTQGSRYVHDVPKDFEKKNGSTGIVRVDLTGVPPKLSIKTPQLDIIRSMSGPYVDLLFGAHGAWGEYLGESGRRIEPLPFPAAIWEIGTGENLSGNLTSARDRRLIDAGVTRDFGLALPSRLEHHRTTALLTGRRLKRRIKAMQR